MKSWKTNLFQTIFFFASILCIVIIYSYIRAYQLAAGSTNFLTAGSLIIFILFGGVLGWERFYKESHKAGKWRLNVPRFVLIGLPSLLFSNLVFLYDSSIPVIPRIIPKFLVQNSVFETLCQVLFGYILITSFDKVYQAGARVKR